MPAVDVEFAEFLVEDMRLDPTNTAFEGGVGPDGDGRGYGCASSEKVAHPA